MAITKIIRSIVFIIMAGTVMGAAAKTPSGSHTWPPCSEWPFCQPVTHGNGDSNSQDKAGPRSVDKTVGHKRLK